MKFARSTGPSKDLDTLRRLHAQGRKLVGEDFEFLALADGLYTCWKPTCGPAGIFHEARSCPHGFQA